jgi:hypothetical protein
MKVTSGAAGKTGLSPLKNFLVFKIAESYFNNLFENNDSHIFQGKQVRTQ